MPVGQYQRTEEQKEFCRRIGAELGGKKRVLKDKLCSVCGKIFRPASSLQKHCSMACSLKNRPHKGKIRECPVCHKKFYVMPCFIRTNNYCSYECMGKSKIVLESKVKLICKNCGKEYVTYRSQIKWRGSAFCSWACLKRFRATKHFYMKKKKKTTNAIIKKEFWQIFSKYIRQRDNGVCISCGKQDYWRRMDAGHYIPKTAGLSLYFDERNVNCQCTYCNRWMHGNLSRYAIELRKKYGNDILERLDELRRKTIKISTKEYEELIEKYKTKIVDSGFVLR